MRGPHGLETPAMLQDWMTSKRDYGHKRGAYMRICIHTKMPSGSLTPFLFKVGFREFSGFTVFWLGLGSFQGLQFFHAVAFFSLKSNLGPTHPNPLGPNPPQSIRTSPNPKPSPTCIPSPPHPGAHLPRLGHAGRPRGFRV